MKDRAQIPGNPETVPKRSQSLHVPLRTVRRKCACGDSSTAECDDCKHKKLQRRATGQGPLAAPAIVREVLSSPGQRLDTQTRSFFGSRFQHDFSKVRVHTDSRAQDSARAVNALAYTVGSDIAFAAGQYAPGTHAGARLLAHELAHTIQNPEPAGLFPRLEVGPANDPSEQDADRAADAAVQGGSFSLARTAAPVLRRKQVCLGGKSKPEEDKPGPRKRTCQADAPTAAKPDQCVVHCDDGSEYRVTLTTTPKPPSPDTCFEVNAGFGNNALFLTIEICHGDTEVQITPNVDLSAPLQQAIGNIIAGSGVLTGVKVSPELKITVFRSQSASVSVGPTVTVGQGGVTGGGVSTTVSTPKVNVTGNVTYDSPTKAVGLSLSFSAGTPQKKVSCYKKEKPYLVFTCESVKHIAAVPEVEEKSVTDTEVRYVFFPYKKFDIRRDFRLPTDIQSLYDQGYRVTTVEGFTSPEGPRKAGPNFEGNIELSKERAQSALDWLQAEACPKCDLTGATKVPRSELPPQMGAVEPEPKGREMERAAVSEFLGKTEGSTADPLAPKTPEEVAAFEKLPESKQRDKAFELMRRAAITLKRKRITQAHSAGSPARDDTNKVACDQEVIEAAREAFKITIPGL